MWDVRLLEEHGVDSYPFASDGVLNLRCKERKSHDQRPELTVQSNIPLRIELRWHSNSEILNIQPSSSS